MLFVNYFRFSHKLLSIDMELSEIEKTLRDTFKQHSPPLQARIDTDSTLEMSGTKEVMQGRKKVQGIYFGSIMPKPKDIRLYFFPIYTHADQFKDIPENLRKCLKGKSCFHIKKMDDDLKDAIESMIKKGVDIYTEDELL